MEKKNINIGVVRTCTILLLTVFTIGRKYGEEQKATDLINNLKQQPCACCLNFENVDASAGEIDEAKRQLETAKTKLETAQIKLEENIKEKEKDNNNLQNDNNNLRIDNNNLRNDNSNLLDEKNQLQNQNKKLEEEKNNINNLLEEKNSKVGELNKNIEKISEEKETWKNKSKTCFKLYQEFKEKNSNLEDILKNTKTNVNTEEYVKFYNSISAEKKAKIVSLLHEEVLEDKEYKFYVPFKFKDYKGCFKKKEMPGLFNHNVGYYSAHTSFQDILKSLFLRYGIEQINKEKIIDVKILKEIYFYVNFQYCKVELKKYDKMKKDFIKYYEDGILNKDEKLVPNTEVSLGEEGIILPVNCFYTTSEEYENKQKILVPYFRIGNGVCYDGYKDKILLNYYDLIELVKIDEYWGEKEKFEDDEDVFLLELDFKDPECIALLESVGKGNYGVVKKGLTFENGNWVTKAIKFTCTNSKFPNSSEENILKEIRAGKIVNEIGVGNKIAFVKDYMKIKKFKKRYEYNEKEEEKIVPCGKETDDGTLTNAVYTTFLNNNLEALPEEKRDVKVNFENNVFSKEGEINEDLYIMFMDIVNGKDLFFNKKEDNININSLGKMLFDVLNNLCIYNVALKDIKPKNIIWDKKKNEFSIIDVQTLGLVGRNLTDSCGTPELWPFFKTLNLNLGSDNKIENVNKNKLYDVFCNSIDDNFVDIYAACMTMYFARFRTYTAAGLLTLLLKWIILEKDEETSIVEKIEFLKDYENKYTSYIKDIKNNKKNDKEILKNEIKNPIEDKKDPNEDKKLINYFFEKIDDKNLNDDQKKNLANLLKQVITLGDKSNIFYLLEETKNFVKKYENKYNLNNDIENIINFYKLCVEKDFNNFAKLSKDNCKYADVIKYVLCYGSCLNYIGDNKGEMKVDDILKQLVLKNKIEFNDKEFFDNIDYVKNEVIEKLKKGFNQIFIIDLLKKLPLEEYEEILNYGVSKNSVDYYFEKKMKDEPKTIKKEDIVPKTKAFYLLRYLEINKLFHIPKRLVKIKSLINENTDDEFKENII